MLHGPGDLRVKEVPEPTIQKPTDAIIRLAASCVCGVDLKPRKARTVRRRLVLHLGKYLGATRIIAMSRHKSRQDLALEFGATDIVTQRGEDGIAKIREMTANIGADAIPECVGTEESIRQAILPLVKLRPSTRCNGRPTRLFSTD